MKSVNPTSTFLTNANSVPHPATDIQYAVHMSLLSMPLFCHLKKERKNLDIFQEPGQFRPPRTGWEVLTSQGIT